MQSLGGGLNSQGVLLVLFSFCFLRKIARGHAHSYRGKYLALSDSPDNYSRSVL